MMPLFDDIVYFGEKKTINNHTYNGLMIKAAVMHPIFVMFTFFRIMCVANSYEDTNNVEI